MPRSRSSLAAGLLLMLAVLPAAATATLTCDADDRNLTLNLLGNIGRGDATLQVTGLSIKLKAVRGGNDEIEFEQDAASLVQQWVFEKELRIGIQTTEKKDISLYLAIVAQQTKSKDEGDRYRGRYVLKVQRPKGARELRGRIKDCVAG